VRWLLSRETMIALAVAGALLSVAASSLGARLGRPGAAWLSRLGYACMGASMVLFVLLGFMAQR